MRILHTSDWHLGMSVGTGTLAGDQRFFLEQLYDIGVKTINKFAPIPIVP